MKILGQIDFLGSRNENKDVKRFKDEPVFIQILVRYIAAIFVAFVASFATIFIGFEVMAQVVSSTGEDKYGELFDLTIFAITGFAGVFSGTFCLEQKHRRFGSIVLLGLGLVFSSLFSLPNGEPGDVLSLLYTLWPLMVGGTAAVLLNWFKLRKRTDVN